MAQNDPFAEWRASPSADPFAEWRSSAPADATGAGGGPVLNQNLGWARTAANAPPFILGQVGAKAGFGLGGTAGELGGAWAGGVTGEALAEPLRTLLGLPTPAPFSWAALQALNQAGNEQMTATGLGHVGANILGELGKVINRRAINPPKALKVGSGETLRKQTELADRVLARRFPGGVLESAEAAAVARNKAAGEVKDILAEAGAQSTGPAIDRPTIKTGPLGGTVAAPEWSTIAGPNAARVQEQGLARVLGQMRGENPVSNVPESPGLPTGYAYEPMELRPAVDRVIAKLGKGKNSVEQIRSIGIQWEKFLRDHPNEMTPQQLKDFKDEMWASSRTMLKAQKQYGNLSPRSVAGAMLDKELGYEANTMLRRISGLGPAEAKTAELIHITRALENAALRPTGPMPWYGVPFAPLIHATKSYQVAKALASPVAAELARLSPATAAYLGSILFGLPRNSLQPNVVKPVNLSK